MLLWDMFETLNKLNKIYLKGHQNFEEWLIPIFTESWGIKTYLTQYLKTK